MRTVPEEVLVLGTGATAGWHAAAVRRWLPEARLVIAGRDVGAAAALASRCAAEACSLDAALATPARGNSLAIVTLPPVPRRPWVEAALRSGRHVLSEKPLAATLPEARALLQLAEQQGVVLASCGSRFLEHPATRAVTELLRVGHLGRVLGMHLLQRRVRARPGIEYQPGSSWFLDPQIAGGGVLLDWGPYDLALIDETLCPQTVRVVHANLARPLTEIDPAGLAPGIEQQLHATLLCQGPFGEIPVYWERTACSHLPEQELTALEGESSAVSWQWKDWEPGNYSLMGDREGQWVVRSATLGRDGGIPLHDRPLVGLLRAMAGDPAGALLGSRLRFLVELLFAVQATAMDGTPRTIERPAG